MSQNVFTKNGWVQTSGNVNPKLINDVNQRIDGYVEKGYLSDNLAKPISEWNNFYYPTAVGQDISNTTASTRFATSQLLKGGVYTINVKTKGTVNILAWGINGTTIEAYRNFNVSLSDNTQTFDGSAYEYVAFGIREDVAPQIVKNSVYQIQLNEGTVVNTYVPSNVELQSEIDKLGGNKYYSNDLSFSGCSYNLGGYVKIGNLVLINIRVTASATNFSISGLPLYNNVISGNAVPITIYDGTNNTTEASGYVNHLNGTINIVKATSGRSYFINAFYLCNE